MDKSEVPKNGHKKAHVEGGVHKKRWTVEKFQRIYKDFRKTFAGKPQELARYYYKHRLTGIMVTHVAHCLTLMAM